MAARSGTSRSADTAWLRLKTGMSSRSLFRTSRKASCCRLRLPLGVVRRTILVRGSLKNPYLVVIGALTVILLGAIALSRIPTDILPTFRTPAVQILTLYPGMPAETMERDITSRLERWTGQSNGVVRQESRSMTGTRHLPATAGAAVDQRRNRQHS